MTRFLDNFTTYLGLAGLVTLMIGGIGVSISVHAFLNGRTGTIAILKCLGGTSSTIQAVYLSLALILGGIGGLGGVVLGMGIHRALLSLLSAFLPSDFQSHAMFLPALRGMAMGFSATLLFSLWPLRVIRRVPPFRVFRQDAEVEPKGWPDRTGWLLAAVLILCWIGLSIWQAGSWRMGTWAVSAIGISVLLLLAASFGITRLTKRMSRYLSSRPGSGPGSLALRYGIGNLHRPGRLVAAIVLSVGIGVMVLLTLVQVEQSLTTQIRQNIPEAAPSFFFIDLQPDQRESFEITVKKWELKQPPQMLPLIRSRLYDVDGKKVSEMNTEDRPDGWYFTREYVLTFQKDLPEHNSLRRGKWWNETPGSDREENMPLISVETEAARHLGIDLGSTVTFDIQGKQVSAKVASLRDVDWGSFTTNFFFIFSPGALKGMPVTYVATVTTRQEEDMPLQNAVIETFPNVTAIHIREVLEIISGILQEIVRSVRFMALFGLLAGLIILSAAIYATRLRRLREMTLFKILGATRPTLIAVMTVEYGLLGFVAALVGGLLSTVLSWGIVHFFFDIPWRFDPAVLLTGLTGTIVLTILTGFLTSYRILGEKPLAVLRSE
jgi:putative ABC transport system permease protein